MRCSYDLKNPIERNMFFEKQKRTIERANNHDLTLNEAIQQVMEEHQKELEYFYYKDIQEKQMQAELEKQLKEQIENIFPDVLEEQLSNLFQDFNAQIKI